MTNDEHNPQLHIDADWKAQAQAEKQRLAAKEQSKTQAAGERGLPEASFQTLMSVLASQAIMGLGAYADPKTGKAVVDLEGARFSIDLLGVLDEKTKGNITKEEADELRQLLQELRARYVQITELVSRQMGEQAAQPGAPQQGQPGQPGAAASPPERDKGSGSVILDP